MLKVRRSCGLLCCTALLVFPGCRGRGFPQPQNGPREVDVGYGTREEDDLTGAVTSVTETSTPPGPVRLEELLRGRAAGLEIIPLNGWRIQTSDPGQQRSHRPAGPRAPCVGGRDTHRTGDPPHGPGRPDTGRHRAGGRPQRPCFDSGLRHPRRGRRHPDQDDPSIASAGGPERFPNPPPALRSFPGSTPSSSSAFLRCRTVVSIPVRVNERAWTATALSWAPSFSGNFRPTQRDLHAEQT